MKIAFVANDSPGAANAREMLEKRYGSYDLDEASIIVALGGDGLMLQTLHQLMGSGKPIYGMNRGSVGFLMNEYVEDDLVSRIAAARISTIHPLKMTAIKKDGTQTEAFALNEVSLFRSSFQAAKIEIRIDDKIRLEELVCDGVLVATPTGSTAYNLSAHGPILPINAPLLALTPLSPFRPRRWRGALVPDTAQFEFSILQPEKRPVNAVADHTEVRDICTVRVESSPNIECLLMFDPDHNWDERILNEQFLY